MKHQLFSILTMIAVAGVLATAYGRPARMRPDAHSKPSGGIVEKPYNGNFFQIINAQKAVSDKDIRAFTLKMRMETLLAFQSRQEKPLTAEEARQTATAVLKEPRIAAGLVIVDDPAKSAYIESAEGRWAILNVAALKVDRSNHPKLVERCEKMLWRAAARALGVGYSNHDISVLMPFSSLEELDANNSLKPAPDGINAFMNNAAAYGMTPLTIASYRTACRNGWAPAPTNDIQKAIWDEIHAMPTEPLKIKPETKKVRE